MLLESDRDSSILPSGRRPCAEPSFSFWCCRCRVRQPPICLRFTARSTRRTTGTTEIRHPQFLLLALATLLWVAGAVATAIRQLANAGDRLIYVEGRLSGRPLSYRYLVTARSAGLSQQRESKEGRISATPYRSNLSVMKFLLRQWPA
jgi:hypothetical protein